jgi:hypothetical protein
MIKVGKLIDAFPGPHYALPQTRAAALGYAGLDYLQASVLVVESHEHVGPLFNFVLPTMHQTLELLSKAIAFTAVPGFNPRKYSHHVRGLVRDCAGQVPVFASMLSDPNTVDLLDNLEKSYQGVRYGECCLTYDREAWLLFLRLAEGLLDDLNARTKIPFLKRHFKNEG